MHRIVNETNEDFARTYSVGGGGAPDCPDEDYCESDRPRSDNSDRYYEYRLENPSDEERYAEAEGEDMPPPNYVRVRKCENHEKDSNGGAYPDG